MSSDHFALYKKRGGTDNLGRTFEYLSCAYYALTLSTNDNINDFSMTTNNEKFSSFDDVCLEIDFIDNTKKTYLLQLKHKAKAPLMGSSHLTDPKKEFSLLKVMKAFDEMDTMPDDYVCILCTNAPTNIQNNDKFFVSNIGQTSHDAEIIVREAPSDDLNILFTGNELSKIFRFHVKCERFKRLEAFSNRFYLLPNQASVFEIEPNIDRLLKRSYYSDIYDVFMQFMQTWWSRAFVLTKHDIIAKLTEFVVSPWIRIVSGDKGNLKTRPIASAIKKCDLTIVKSDKGIVENIWTEIDDCERIRKAVDKYSLGFVDISNKQKSVALWYLNLAPLIVDVDHKNEKVVVNAVKRLSKCLKDKTVVLIGNNLRRKDFDNLKVFETLNDLTCDTLEEDFTYIIDNFRVGLPGKFRVSLKQLTQEESHKMAAILSCQLLELSQKDPTIDEQARILSEIHLPRNVA